MSIRLRVLTWNIWRGGEQVRFDKIVEVIRLADADIVALQETEGNMIRLAHACDYPFYSLRLQIMSRLPLADPRMTHRGTKLVAREGDFSLPFLWVQVAPGQLATITNVHLPSDHDGPEALLDNKTDDTIIGVQEHMVRGTCVEHLCHALEGLQAHTIVMGDFNSPSHRDCPDQLCRVAWPVTRVMERYGFVDAYREIYPDSTSHPGLTWTAGYPHPHITDEEQLNRIDYVWYRSPRDIDNASCRIMSANLIGESGKHMHRGRHINAGVTQSVMPWPSDHRALVVEMELFAPTQVKRPLVGLVNPSYSHESVEAHLIHPKNDKESLELALVVPDARNHAKIIQSLSLGMGSSKRSRIAFGLPDKKLYEQSAIVLCRRETTTQAVSVLVPVENSPCFYQAFDLSPTRSPSVQARLDASAAATGDMFVQVSWQHAPGNKWDWIGVFDLGETDIESAYAYAYLDGTTHGTATWDLRIALQQEIDKHSQLQVRMYLDDSTRLLASSAQFARVIRKKTRH